MIRFRLSLLEQRLETMPFLKILLPFAFGIGAAEWWSLSPWWLVVGLLYGVVGLRCFDRSIYLIVVLVASGWLNRSMRPDPITFPKSLRTCYEVRVTADAAPNKERSRSEGVLMRWCDPTNGRWYDTDERVMLVADSTVALHDGDRILFEGVVYALRPAVSGYHRLMQRRGYAGTLYLNKRSVLVQESTASVSFHTRASRTLRDRLQAQTTEAAQEAAAVVRAMCIGDRGGLTPDLRESYARSGMAHLLAVSGLHTGMVFCLINLVLWWLPLLRRGHLLRNLLSIVVLWLFVAAAGFPPSAIRAAVMCTLLQVALASSSTYQAMNAWSAAAFGMLLWNPRWIGDVSFQLSFVAVAAILLWGVPLCRRVRSGSWLLDQTLHAVVIGLVASVATAPLVSYHFGVVPWLGVWFNPVVILLGTILVAGGLLVLLCPVQMFVPPLSDALIAVAELQNSLSYRIAAVEQGVWTTRCSAGEAGAIYLIFLLFTVVGWCIERKKSVHLSYVE